MLGKTTDTLSLPPVAESAPAAVAAAEPVHCSRAVASSNHPEGAIRFGMSSFFLMGSAHSGG